MGATAYSDKIKQDTDERVLDALQAGPLAVSQIAKIIGLSYSGVACSLERLCREGYARETGVKVRTSEFARGAAWGMTFELGNPREMTQKIVRQWDEKPFRDWRDVALFGEYARAA